MVNILLFLIAKKINELKKQQLCLCEAYKFIAHASKVIHNATAYIMAD